MSEKPTVRREQVIGYRWRVQELGRGAGAGDVDLLDFGVQDTGVGGAGWAMAVRGGAVDGGELVGAWTLRGAPHVYRRGDVAEVVVATAPLSEADAGKRIFDAYRQLKRAGIAALAALKTVAGYEREIVAGPTGKGELSSRLSERLAEPYLRWCRGCQATHVYEMPFRMAALQAGLEIELGTSPPVVRRIPGYRPKPYAVLGDKAQPRYDVVRNYLRFYGPARVRDVAVFLDAPVVDVQARWPADVVEVDVTDEPGTGRFILAADLPALTAGTARNGAVRLVGGYDPYLQLKDRELLVPEKARRAALWPVLGRPGAVLVDGEIAGTWRAKASGRNLTVTVDPWGGRLPAGVEAEAERFAAYRGLRLAGVATG
jgi:winged helix DNA-binding protein